MKTTATTAIHQPRRLGPPPMTTGITMASGLPQFSNWRFGREIATSLLGFFADDAHVAKSLRTGFLSQRVVGSFATVPFAPPAFSAVVVRSFDGFIFGFEFPGRSFVFSWNGFRGVISHAARRVRQVLITFDIEKPSRQRLRASLWQ